MSRIYTMDERYEYAPKPCPHCSEIGTISWLSAATFANQDAYHPVGTCTNSECPKAFKKQYNMYDAS